MEQFSANTTAIIIYLASNPWVLTPLLVLPLAVVAFAYIKNAGDITRLDVGMLAGVSLLTLCLFILVHTPPCTESDGCHAASVTKNSLDNVDSTAAASNPVSTQQNQLALASAGVSVSNAASRCVTTRKTCELLDSGGLTPGMPCYCKTALGFYPGTAH